MSGGLQDSMDPLCDRRALVFCGWTASGDLDDGDAELRLDIAHPADLPGSSKYS